MFDRLPLMSSCDPAEPAGEPRSGVARPSRGKLLLHCFLQGLKAGLSEGTGRTPPDWRKETCLGLIKSAVLADARHQVAMQLLHSEWEYVSTLNQLYDRYRTPPAHQLMVEPKWVRGQRACVCVCVCSCFSILVRMHSWRTTFLLRTFVFVRKCCHVLMRKLLGWAH